VVLTRKAAVAMPRPMARVDAMGLVLKLVEVLVIAVMV